MQLQAHLRLCQRCLRCYGSGLRLLSQSSAHGKSVNYYNTLGVKSDASIEEIKKAFFVKSKELHPDRDPSNPALHSQFVELSEAYRVLSRANTRRDYDFKIRHRYAGGYSVKRSSSSNGPSAETTEDNSRYWDQFYPPINREASAKERIRRNYQLLGICVLAMLVSIAAHAFLFRKIDTIHSNFLEEKDRIYTQIYNESKERARLNGLKKQAEILRQKQADFRNKKPKGDEAK